MWVKKMCIITEWEKRDDCGTNIGSLDFVREQTFKGYLETQGLESSGSRGFKKNTLWLLRNSALELLRQEGAEDTGFIMRGYAGLSGGGIPTCLLQELWHGETGTVFLDSRQSLLYKSFCFFRGKALPGSYPTRCSKGTSSGLEDCKGVGQTVYA